MSKPEFVYTTFIRSTPEKVFHALSETAFTEKYWMGCILHSDWKVGSPMKMDRGGKTMNDCVILESDPPRKLSYSWLTVFDEAMKKEKPSKVTFLIEARDAEIVKLTVTHDGFSEGSTTLPSISNGWPMVLASLKSLLETGVSLHIEPGKGE